MNPFTDLQAAIAQRLNNDPYFSDSEAATPKPLVWLTENVGELEYQIDKAVAEIGLSPIVVTPKMTPGNARRVVNVDVVLQLTENVIVNRAETGTQKPAIEAAMIALALLWDGSWRAADIWAPMQFKGAELIETTPNLIYQVTLQTSTVLAN